MRGVIAGLLSLFLVCEASLALAQPQAPAAPQASKPSVALIGFDALGMDEERVQRLETLFLKELERLTARQVPSRRAVARLAKRLRGCDGQNKCLSAIGRALQVDFVVSGNVAELGDSYILNIKAIASDSGAELRRIESDPLRGKPDELIEAIRVAAYRLLSPDELVGSISILADRDGAIVELDSQVIGKTPLSEAIDGLSLGMHKLRVTAGEFGEFESEVKIRFQKTARVVVNLVDLRAKAEASEGSSDPSKPLVARDAPRAWYQKRWVLITAGAFAAVLGGYVGYRMAQDPVIHCSEDPALCMP